MISKKISGMHFKNKIVFIFNCLNNKPSFAVDLSLKYFWVLIFHTKHYFSWRLFEFLLVCGNGDTT